ncbi:cation:proton antiporter [Leucobacter allii]|uniref:cation:proton antiporter domain-containing protein n=1 Tax=Leucobacter allii TaxID=2932247 RepID=UPI001FD0BEE3|nr:cation:proton antiporter [Leucobacter allii]UOR02248.1 cation:proton antiporter [Leucobacter allii]
MIPLLVCCTVAILAWSLVGARLQRWHFSGPVVMVLSGIAIGFAFQDSIETGLNTQLAEHIVELILALLLFVDATEVRGGFFAGARGPVLRLLLIALPVSIVLAVVVGVPLLGTSVFAVLAIACIVLPIDFAPAAELLRDPRLPRRTRHALAVESGYNDGIFSPIFAFALIVLGLSEANGGPLGALEEAIPAAGYAVLVGGIIGGAAGLGARLGARRGWATPSGLRIAMVLVPVVTYACALPLHGNGFVAAFIAGLVYKPARLGRRGFRKNIPHAELSLADDLGVLSSLVMWFVFGAVASLILVTPVEWSWILFALLALTLLRIVPVLLAFLGSGVTLREQAALGLLGPRGTSSIVFGLLAFNAMRDDDANVALYVLIVVVLGSVVLHSLFGRRLAGALAAPDPAGISARRS